MTSGQKYSQKGRPTTANVLVGFGLMIVLAEYGQVACPLSEVFGAAVKMALRMLPSMVLAAWQAFQGHGGAHAPLCEGLSLISASYWPTLLNFAGVA